MRMSIALLITIAWLCYGYGLQTTKATHPVSEFKVHSANRAQWFPLGDDCCARFPDRNLSMWVGGPYPHWLISKHMAFVTNSSLRLPQRLLLRSLRPHSVTHSLTHSLTLSSCTGNTCPRGGRSGLRPVAALPSFSTLQNGNKPQINSL